jgi:hypothetical protein
VTGEQDPEAAARWVLQRPGARTKWCVVKLGGAGSLAVARGADGGMETVCAPAFEVRPPHACPACSVLAAWRYAMRAIDVALWRMCSQSMPLA